MVRVSFNYHRKRFAFTMIELIFAIVIIAIAVVSLPVMNQAIQKGTEEAIVQEAIFAASTELMGASAGYWDERSMEDESMSQFSRVINIGGDCNTTTKLRPGHIAQSLHRRCLDSNLATGLDSTTNTNVYSLDDAEKTDDIFITNGTSGGTPEASGYKNTYKYIIVVNRVAGSDIKDINVTITDDQTPPNTLVILKIQSANIGEVDYYKRTF